MAVKKKAPDALKILVALAFVASAALADARPAVAAAQPVKLKSLVAAGPQRGWYLHARPDGSVGLGKEANVPAARWLMIVDRRGTLLRSRTTGQEQRGWFLRANPDASVGLTPSAGHVGTRWNLEKRGKTVRLRSASSDLKVRGWYLQVNPNGSLGLSAKLANAAGRWLVQ